MLTEKELEKLTKTERGKYLSLDTEEKEMLEITFRESGIFEEKKETRGRHPKPCNKGENGTECEKCKAKRIENEKGNTTDNSEPQTRIETITETGERSGGDNSQTENKTEKSGEKTEEEILNEHLNKFRESETQFQKTEFSEAQTKAEPETKFEQPKPEVDITQFISGALFLTAMDYAFPIAIKFVVGFFEKKYSRINERGMKKLSLTEEERKYLEPSAEQVVKYIFADANPIVVFAVVTGSIYGGKMMLLSEDDFSKPISTQTKK